MENNVTLLDLQWEDIILENIMPYLSLEDCFTFRSTSKICYDLANAYISRMKTLKILDKRPSMQTYNVLSSNCKKLNVINLCKAVTLTDNVLLSILTQNSNLNTLNLNRCSSLTAKCIQPVIISKKSNLKTLKLAHCYWMTDGALEAISLHQSELENVDLSFCHGITERSIEVFLKKFQKLNVLNLEGNFQVTDKTLMVLAIYSKNLKLLNVSKCSKVTDNGIKAIASNCVHLEGVLSVGCPMIFTGHKFLTARSS